MGERLVVGDDLGDAEVQHLQLKIAGMIARLEVQVPRLHIPVDQPGPVTRREAASRLMEQLRRFPVRRQFSAGEPMGEILAPQQLHHQKVQLQLRIGPEIVDCDHVRVMNPRRRPGLAVKASA